MTPEQPRRGRPPVLTEEAIARAVLEVGFPNLTFAAVRERLGVGESTLYRHAPDRDSLVRIALEHAMSRVKWPSTSGPWRQVLETYALTAWRAWEEYPGSATEAARGIIPSAMAQLLDSLCTALMRHGFSAKNAVLACDIVFDLVADNRRGVEHIDSLVPGVSRGRAHFEEVLVSAPSGRDGRAEPQNRAEIREALRGALAAAPIDWFTAKLTVVLDGVEAALAP